MSHGSRKLRCRATLAIAAVATVALAAALLPRPAAAQDGAPKMPPAPSAPASPAKVRPSPAVVTVTPGRTTPIAQAGATRAPAERGELSITVDRAKVIRLPERTQTVVVGNPSIADLAIQKNGIVVVTGKSYGVTNLIALDGEGNMLAESTVSVGAPTEAIVVVQRGLERQSYSCTPSCQPSILLGDANGYFNENRGQAEQRNQFATSR